MQDYQISKDITGRPASEKKTPLFQFIPVNYRIFTGKFHTP